MNVTINLETARPRLKADDLPALVTHYLNERSFHLDPLTIKGYRLYIDYFLVWWEVEGPKRDWMLDENTFGEYIQYLQGISARLGWHSRHTALRRLRQLLRWANQRGYISVDFAEFVPPLKGNAKPKLPVHLDVLRSLLEACKETNEPERNQAIIAVLAGTSVRSEECAALRVEDIVLYEDGSGLITLSVAKNDKLRTVAFDPDTATFLCEWIVMLPYDKGPLFPSRIDRNSGMPIPLTPHGIYRVVRKLADWGEVADQIQGPHDLRRMFATTWGRIAEGQGSLLQKQMGHSSYATTLGYILQDPNDIREAITKKAVSPIAVLAKKAMPPKEIKPKAYMRRLERARQTR
jgi:integrase/recombinase XerD